MEISHVSSQIKHGDFNGFTWKSTSPCRDRTFDLFISKLVMEAEGIIWSQLYLNVNKCSWFPGVKLNGIKVMYCVEKFKIHNVHLNLFTPAIYIM